MNKVLSPLIVLEPQDLNLLLTRKSVDCVAWFTENHPNPKTRNYK